MLSSSLPEPTLAPEQILDCLGAIAFGIYQTQSLDDILNVAVREARKLIQTDRLLIYRFQADGSGVVVAESVDSSCTSLLSQTIYDPCFTSKKAEAYRQGQFSAITDIYADNLQPCYLELLSQFQVRANLVIPILINTPTEEFRIQKSEFTIESDSPSKDLEDFKPASDIEFPSGFCLLTPNSFSNSDSYCHNPKSEIPNQLWGLLIAHQCSSFRQWQPLEVKLLEQIAVQIAIAIEQANAFESFQQELTQRKEAEKNLRRQQEFLRNVIDTNPNLICVKDWEGRFRLANQALADIYGTSVEELIGKTDADFNANRVEVEHYLHDDRQVISSLQPKFISEETLTSPTGEVHYLQTVKKPLLSPDGKNVYVLATATDITVRKRAKQECDKAAIVRYRAVVEWHRAAIARHRAAVARQRAVAERQRLCRELERQNQILEAKVRERTVQLSLANEELKQEVAERKQAEEALRHSEEKFRQMAENIECVFWISNFPMTQTDYISPAYEKIWGRPCAELYASPKSWLDAVHPEDRSCVTATLAKTRQDEHEKEYRIVRPDGEIRWIRDRSFPIQNQTGQVYRVVGIAQDISDRKLAEDRLKSALLEKETLLKEIHHRVKNNLQVISSLLRLQSRQIQDRQTLELFKESQNRVQAMALIHEKLYQSSNLAQIHFREYITTLVGNLCRSYGTQRQAVSLKINVEQVSLAIDTAIPCGLIINELVTNSLKYAFPENQGGEICISLQFSESPLNVSFDTNKFILTVSDNGIGLPEDVDFRNTSSLGLQLVCRLTKQIGGSIELNRSQGTEFKIEFTKPKS